MAQVEWGRILFGGDPRSGYQYAIIRLLVVIEKGPGCCCSLKLLYAINIIAIIRNIVNFLMSGD